MRERCLNDQYRTLNSIAAGSFGEIFAGENRQTRQSVAIKIENHESDQKRGHLEREVVMYRYIDPIIGFPKPYENFNYDGREVLVMELLGTSLDALHKLCHRQFTLKTTLIIADQILSRLDYIHKKGIVHNDIQPGNITIGCGSHSNQIYLIDFGLAAFYFDPNDGHMFHPKEIHAFTGTTQFASINVHNGFSPLPRDDLESLAYLLVYLLKGRLPWHTPRTLSKEQKVEMVARMKTQISPQILFEGLPEEFCQFYQYVRALTINDLPHYSEYRQLFRNLFIRSGFVYDSRFDWNNNDLKFEFSQPNPPLPTRPPPSSQRRQSLKDRPHPLRELSPPILHINTSNSQRTLSRYTTLIPAAVKQQGT